MHSLSANFVVIRRYHNPESDFREVGTIRLMKPNYLYQQDWDAEKNKKSGLWKKQGDSRITASDGKTFWGVMSGGEYQKADVKMLGNNLMAYEMPTYDFFSPSQSVLAQVRQQQAKNQLIALTCAGTAIWQGRSYRLVDWEYKPNYDPGETVKNAPGGVLTEKDRIYIGSDNLIYRVQNTYNVGWSGERVLQDVKLNAPLTAASFKFTLPLGAHLPTPPKLLLANGTLAPDFAAVAPDGSIVHLSDYKGKTVVVLDFWSTWCGPCQMSLPHLEKVYQQVKGKVAVLGVCVWDEKPAYDKWIVAKKGTYNFPTAFDPAGRGDKSIASSLYHVSGIPTQYVIDKDGKIAASTVGYDEGGTFLEAALNKLGTNILVPTAHK